MTYIEAEIKIVTFGTEDVIRTSGGEGDENEMGGVPLG